MEKEVERPFPSITMKHIESIIAKVEYALFDTLTIAVVTLDNGFKVVGESACADARNFDKELGRKYALENAKEKVWMLEGYLLRDSLAYIEDNFS